VPIAKQEKIEGHSVRAMYLLTAVADLVRISEPDSKVAATFSPVVSRLWSNMVEKRSYVTGGIGAIKQWEGFGIDYFLPQGTDEGGCYAETCAAIGVMMLAERRLQVGLLLISYTFTAIYMNISRLSSMAIMRTSWSSVFITPY
jgi:DUF1680 family protein